MKRIITIAILLVSTAITTQSQETGYLVFIEDKKENNTEVFKTQCTETLQKSILLNTGVEIDVEKILEGDNVFFEFRMNDINYYVEKKRVTEKKSGKKVYRKITKKERKELAGSGE